MHGLRGSRLRHFENRIALAAPEHKTGAAIFRIDPYHYFLRSEWAIVHRCKRCGMLSSNRVAADDNPMKLMSIALKPLCEPPFPLERIEEMTALMGGEGTLK